MPILRPRPTKSEKEEERRCLRQLYREGVDVENPGDSDSAVDISVIGGLETLIFNLRRGLAGYVVALRLVAKKSGLILQEPEITTEFDDQIVLESFDPGGLVCQVGQCQYAKSKVLNDCFPLKFNHRGYMVEKMILATGLKPIPEHAIQGMRVPFKLTFWDQFGNEISVESDLSVDRSTTPGQRLVRPKSSLRDPEEIEPRALFGENPAVQATLGAARTRKAP